MALNNLKFTFADSGQEIELKRVMYSISHRYVWDGHNPVKVVNSIRATGLVLKGEENLNPESYDSEGTLILPHTTMSHMAVKNIEYQQGIWATYGRVSITFDDEMHGGLDDYAITWYGYKLYDAKVSVNPSTIKRAEAMVYDVDGWLRQQMGHNNLSLQITGVYTVPSGVAPNALVNTMQKRYEVDGTYPSGYPQVFDLTAAVPEASGYFDIRQCIVTKGTLQWHYNKRYANVTIDIIAPPQTITW